MTMSVLAVREAAEGDGTGAGARAREARVFAKGSFEAIAARCAPPPPSEWAAEAEAQSKAGCYVIALAGKRVQARGLVALTRAEAEQGLGLIGLLLFRNEPKADSAAAIAELRAGGVECVMVRRATPRGPAWPRATKGWRVRDARRWRAWQVTGDSALTGVAIAEATDIIPAGHRVVLGDVGASGELEWREISAARRAAAAAEDEGALEPARCESGAAEGEGVRRGPPRGAARRDSGSAPAAPRGGLVSLAVTGAGLDALLASGALEESLTCRGCGGGGALIACACPRLRVFGRMTPQQKVQVVRAYAAAGCTVPPLPAPALPRAPCP